MAFLWVLRCSAGVFAFYFHSPLATVYDCIGLLVLVSVGAGIVGPTYEDP